ncbi:MAG: hypothetical protein K2J11_02175 [Oscillospiraceae bacterium]|nr:hypothetical protein [Oscillospiraceae bacterium]
MAEFDNRYSSNGKANAALATGIIGTAGVGLGLLGGLGNGLWGSANCNRAGWDNYGPCSDNTPVTRYEMGLQQQLAEKDAAIALRDANTYNDQKSLQLYQYVDGRFREFEAALASQAVVNQKTADDIKLVRKDVEIEAERRCCADNAIVNYANATFYAKLIAGVTPTTTDPTPQSTYNPIPNCKPCCNN